MRGNSKSYDHIYMTIYGGLGRGPKKKRLTFVGDLDSFVDSGSSVILRALSLLVAEQLFSVYSKV